MTRRSPRRAAVVRRLCALGALAVLAAAAPPRPSGERGPPDVRRISVTEDRSGERFLRSPLAMARDAKTGELVVSSFETAEVVVLDRSGALVARFGADAGLVTPYGVAVDAAGRIYVSELRTGRIKILGAGGAAVDVIDLSAAAGRTVTPGRITLGRDGLLLVADLTGNEILVVRPDGTLGRTLGPLPYVQKADVAADGRVVGLSGQGKAVTLFDGAGSAVRSFGEHGDESERSVSFPTGFALDANGRIWIADAFQHRLKVFSLEGRFLFNFGRPEETTESGGFHFPVDLCFGAPGELIVLEKGAERIQTFRVADLEKAR